eukprot:12286545-Heterocapsa_arctica.AAC.1
MQIFVKTLLGKTVLAKYAEQFAHNFDLIAEQFKNVIYRLRELAGRRSWPSVRSNFHAHFDLSGAAEERDLPPARAAKASVLAKYAE